MKIAAFILVFLMASNAPQQAEYRLALPGYRFAFPRDHGSHPEFKLEWWYFTGQLRTSRGREFGYELTFFRTGMDRRHENPSVWAVQNLHMAHFALTDLANRRFYFFEKLNREGPGIAGARTDTLHAWNENWFALLEGNTFRLRAAAEGVEIDLNLLPLKAPAIHGSGGVSQKAVGVGRASHYYSLTRLQTRGHLVFDGEMHQTSGESWMDHEFGTNQLAEYQVGWDWFSIQLDNGAEMMLYRIRHRDGQVDAHSSGSIVHPDSRVEHLRAQDFQAAPGRTWRSPQTGTVYPVDWRIRLPGEELELEITARMDAQELVTTRSTGIAYWEGAVEVHGTWRGRPVTGRGYVELTGYAERFRPEI